jgi:hypothetical protein
VLYRLCWYAHCEILNKKNLGKNLNKKNRDSITHHTIPPIGALVRVRTHDTYGHEREEKGIVLGSSENMGEQLMFFPAVRVYLIEGARVKIIFMNEVLEILSER